MIKSDAFRVASGGPVRVRIIRRTRVKGIGSLDVGAEVEIPATDARMLIAQRQAEPAPEVQTRTTRKKRSGKRVDPA